MVDAQIHHALAFLKLNKRPDQDVVSLTGKSGHDILVEPLLNKGSATTAAERERVGLRGLLPPSVSTLASQIEREMSEYMHGHDPMAPEKGGVTTEEDTRKWRMLQGLQDRNGTLFYRLLVDHFVDMAPIVYDPTVGWACQNYHKLYRRPRGFYVCTEDRGAMASMVWNWPSSEVDAIVVTDGSRILGLGDLGLNGLGISVGKLDLYVGAAGFHPARVMPCVIDVGTNNEALRGDPLYLGLRQPRLKGDAYYEVVDEFVAAVLSRWPRAVLQFEDFSIEHARPLLDRYRKEHLVFNDDIQGTAAVTLAGLYAAMLAQDKPLSDLCKQRFVVVGAGSAGTGIADMAAQAMSKHGIKREDAARAFWLTDEHGLLTKQRKEEGLSDVAQFFSREADHGDKEGEKLIDTIKRVKPTVLIGVAAAGRLFTEEVLKAMAEASERPIVFPLSNPNSKMECTAAEAQHATGGRTLFASGVPQEDVTEDGRAVLQRQANNFLIFPGLALGAHLGETGIVTDLMLVAAAEALPGLIPKEELHNGALYPRLDDIRGISRAVAVAAMQMAEQQGHLHSRMAQEALKKGGQKALEAWVDVQMYKPDYVQLVRRP